MPDASFLQTSFLGGEWAPNAQGRADSPRYRLAMNTCLNTIPLEVGSATRRPGSFQAGTTRSGAVARIFEFDFNTTTAEPYLVEITAGHLRLWTTAGLVMVNGDNRGLVNISQDTPAVATIGPSPNQSADWSTGDQVMVNVPAGNTPDFLSWIVNRQMTVTKLDSSHYELYDAVSGAAIDGATINWTNQPCTITKILDITVPYGSSDLPNLRAISCTESSAPVPNFMVLLDGKHAPQTLTAANAFNVNFAVTPAQFEDGPYNPDTIDMVLTPSATTGSITVTAAPNAWNSLQTYPIGAVVSYSGTSYASLQNLNVGNTPSSSPTWWLAQSAAGGINGIDGFLTTDVGRMIRMFSQPQLWDSGTHYTAGESVTYQGAYYTALTSNTGAEPDISLTSWSVTPAAATWTWGVITARISDSQAQVTIAGPDLLYVTGLNTWLMGAYSDSTGYPACGAFHEGRLWFSKPGGTGFDASNSNDFFNFAPTIADGTVVDSNAISYSLDGTDDNTICWMASDHLGLIFGSAQREFLAQASALNDPLTPSSIQVHPVSKYGCAPVEPKRTGLSLLFVQKMKRRVMEFITDVFTGRFSAPDLSQFAKHMTIGGVRELAYQEEYAPICWACIDNGSLIGVTYRRISSFSTEEPLHTAWHRHTLGSGRNVIAIATHYWGPGTDPQTLYMVTQDPSTSVCYVEQMQPILDEHHAADDNYLLNAQFLDANTPVQMTSDGTNLTLYGLWPFVGETLTAFVAGIDGGDYTVSASGTMTVPLTGLLTETAISAASGLDTDLSRSYIRQTIFTPAQNPGPATIAEIVVPSDSIGTTQQTPLLDWAHARMFIATTNGIRQYNIGNATQNETASATGSSIDSTWNGVTLSGAWLDNNGNPLVQTREVGYVTKLIQVNGSTLALKATFGSDVSELPTYDATHIPWLHWIGVTACGTFASAGAAQQGYAVCGFYEAVSGNNVYVVNTDTMTTASFVGSACGGGALRMCGGPSNGNVGTVYMCDDGAGTEATSVSFGVLTIAQGAETWGAGNWPTQNPYMKLESIGTLAASTIDATWTKMQITDMVMDADDGCLVIAASSATGSPTVPLYILKLDPNSLTIRWKTAVTSGWAYGGATLTQLGVTQSRIGHAMQGTFFTPGLTGAAAGAAFVASTGAQFTFAMPGVTNVVPIGFDYINGFGIFSCSYNSSAPGAPSPASGTASIFTGYATLLPGSVWQGYTVTIDADYSIPALAGYTYTSQGQCLRPIAPQDAGAANGPALAKTRREHQFGVMTYNTQGLSIGTDFSRMHKVPFQSKGGTPYALNELFTGIAWDTLDDDYSFDSMKCWQVTRPYPATILAIGGFINTQDR